MSVTTKVVAFCLTAAVSMAAIGCGDSSYKPDTSPPPTPPAGSTTNPVPGAP